MITPRWPMTLGKKIPFMRLNQFTLDFARPFSYTYEGLLLGLREAGSGVTEVVGRRSL